MCTHIYSLCIPNPLRFLCSDIVVSSVEGFWIQGAATMPATPMMHTSMPGTITLTGFDEDGLTAADWNNDNVLDYIFVTSPDGALLIYTSNNGTASYTQFNCESSPASCTAQMGASFPLKAFSANAMSWAWGDCGALALLYSMLVFYLIVR